jgi:Ca2+-binding EF-hand superfamily protein
MYIFINTLNPFKGNLQDQQIDSLRKSLKNVWQKIFCPIDVNSDGNVSCDELTSYVKDVI